MKTAVEWLIQQLRKEWQLEDRDLYLIEQAKEMEKQQIIDSFKEGTKMIDVNDELSAIFNGIVYYDETFTNI